METILVAGGAGFIGSNFIRYILGRYSELRVMNLDKLTYAGNLENLRDIEDDSRYEFHHGDICDEKAVRPLVERSDFVVNFAAETHVDRSIMDPGNFIKTDVYGTFVLLEASKDLPVKRFVQISTDEVYGSVEGRSSKETDAVSPRSPYSASKTAGDMLTLAYHTTYGVPAIVTRGSNNFGPYQYPEKMLPLFITNAIEDRPLPLYGDGLNVRDWIYVIDHCTAIDLVMREGAPGEVYNIGGGNEHSNIEVTELVLGMLGKPVSLIEYVSDRPGHDRRYSLDCSKIQDLGWSTKYRFEEALEITVNWYRDNVGWWHRIKSGEYLEYYRRQYGKRG